MSAKFARARARVKGNGKQARAGGAGKVPRRGRGGRGRRSRRRGRARSSEGLWRLVGAAGGDEGRARPLLSPSRVVFVVPSLAQPTPLPRRALFALFGCVGAAGVGGRTVRFRDILWTWMIFLIVQFSDLNQTSQYVVCSGPYSSGRVPPSRSGAVSGSVSAWRGGVTTSAVRAVHCSSSR